MSIIDDTAGSGLWLFKFDRVLHDGLGNATRRLIEARGGWSWRSADGTLDYVYLAADRPPPSDVSPVHLLSLVERVGASHRAVAACHYVVETDVVDAYEDEFNHWYDQEHLPGLAAVKGTVRAARYRATSGSPRYYACYDLVAIDVLTSAAWLAVRATGWSARIRPMFRNTRRTMFCQRLRHA